MEVYKEYCGVYYDETSPTFLRNQITRNSRAVKDKPQGCLKGSGPYTTVTINGTKWMVHRLIWSMFYGEIPDEMVIDHKDNNPSNNKITNLQCLTSIKNTQKSAKLSEEVAKYIRENYVPKSREFGTRALQRRFNVSHTAIQHVLNDTTWV